MSYPPPPPPHQGGSQPPYPVVPYGYAPPTEGGATAALVCGILGAVGIFVCPLVGLVLGIFGLVLGLRSRQRIRAAGGHLGGDGMALAGAICGGVGAGLSAVYMIVIVLYIGVIIAAISAGVLNAGPSPTP